MSLADRFSRSFVLAADRFADQVDPSGETSLIIASPEQWLDVTLRDIESCRVRQRAFQTVADLDEHFAILGEYKKHHAIAPLLLADAPSLCDPLRVVRDIRVALHLGKNRDHDLIGSVALELCELFVKAISGSI